MSLEVQGLSVDLGGRRVLHEVELSLLSGRTHVLLGPSGCGKSTLLRTVLGLVAPSAGTVTLDGDVLHALPRTELARRIGYVVQHGGLFPHLTAGQNVALAAEALGREPPSLSDAFARLGLEASVIDQLPHTLSGGQRQRVALARALSLAPPVLLMDEPLGAVDPLLRAELQLELRALFAASKTTVVMVTHDLEEALWFGHTITVLHDGRVAQHGPAAEVLERPATDFVRRFVSSRRALERT